MWNLGIKVDGPLELFDDNQVFQAVRERETSKACHNSVAFHLVRDGVAADIVRPHHELPSLSVDV